MYFYFQIVCFLWIINYILCTADKNFTQISECPTEIFSVIVLGHSGLQISWVLQKASNEMFSFSWKTDEGTFEDDYFNRVMYGQYKIPSLKENTLYRINISDGEKTFPDCFIEGKTHLKSNSYPTKPSFKFAASPWYEVYQPFKRPPARLYQPRVRIDWLPCGKKRYCQEGEVAGTHFSVKYRIIHSNQEWRTYEYDMALTYIYGLRPGIKYEVKVTSILGDFQTDSDPQEISIDPVCSSVQSATILPLNESSILIHWKPSQEYLPKNPRTPFGYAVVYNISDHSPVINLNYSFGNSPLKEEVFLSIAQPQHLEYQAVKISNLSYDARYTFFIIPFTFDNQYCSEYRIDYTPQTYQTNVSLSKPELDYQVHVICNPRIWWLPCGQTYDCGNRKPGSYFVAKYKKKGDPTFNEIMVTEDNFVFFDGIKNQTYEVFIESVDQSDRAKSEIKEIRPLDCISLQELQASRK